MARLAPSRIASRAGLASLLSFGLALTFDHEVQAAKTELELAPAPAPPPQEVVRQTYARVILTLGEQSFKHPGFFAYVGEEAVFEFEVGGATHQVSVGIEGEESKGYDLDVIYKKGAAIVLEGKAHVAPGASMKLDKDKIKVEVFIDPHGQVDKGRRKKIGGPDSDDPLG